jgi:DNA-directed RNA polymerase specialized sigma24 family protein
MADDYNVEVAELQAITRRDHAVFSRWFARCEIRLRQSVQAFTHVVDVEAVVQDTAIRVWERGSTITPDGRPGFLLRWARTVALNNARNHAKRAWRQVSLDQHDQPQGASVLRGGDPMLRARIRRCVEQLGKNPRRVLDARLHDGGQHPDRDLAISMGMTFDAFRQNLARGRRALERCLRECGIDVRKYLQ